MLRCAKVLLVFFSVAMSLSVAAQTLPSAADDTFEQFVKLKTTSPPTAYYTGVTYLRQYGISAHSGEVKKWTDAFEHAAPGIYAKRDVDFGLFSSGISSWQSAPLWDASRGNYRVLDLITDRLTRMALIYQNTNTAFNWIPKPLVKALGPSYPQHISAINLFDDGDWQAVISNKPANTTPMAAHQGLYNKLVEMAQTGTIQHVYTFPNNGWVIIVDQNGYSYESIPQGLQDEIKKANANGQTIRYLGVDTKGDWIIVRFRKDGIWEATWNGIPQALMTTVINESKADNHKFEAMELYPDGSWWFKTYR